MEAVKFYEHVDPDGAGSQATFCFGGKVHLSYSDYRDERSDDQSHDTATWTVTGPCDGSCRHMVKMPDQVEKLISEFLSNGTCGYFERM